MTKKKTLKGIWFVLKDAAKGFIEHNVPKLSASLAYFTVFSFPPLLIVIIYLCSFFFGRKAVEGGIYSQIEQFVGKDTAIQMQQIIKSATISGSGTMAIVIGVFTLLIGATSIFAEVQDSINTIWGLKAKPNMGIKLIIKTRLMSFGVIGSLGFLLLVSLGVAAIVEAIGHRLQHSIPALTVIMLYVINLLITFGVTMVLFAVIFKVLPDAQINWNDVWAGALTTAMLFLVGKFGIAFYIAKSKIGTSYGTAGAIVILLLWIYYSSIILYFGAEFTKVWAVKYRNGIKPNSYAVVVEKEQIEKKNSNVKL
ncbi:MAG: YihY/virulence factor BrkB family protein [Ginsengibacter sp.]